MYEKYVGHMLRTRLVEKGNNYHDMFERLAESNATFRTAWFAVAEITSRRVVVALPVSGAHANPNAVLTPALRSRIDRVCAPMFKMTYKGVEKRSTFSNGTVQGYLFQRTIGHFAAALELCALDKATWPCHYAHLGAAHTAQHLVTDTSATLSHTAREILVSAVR